MKKVLFNMFLFIFILCLVGCDYNQGNANNKFKLEVIDNWNLLNHLLEKEYEAGEIVEIHLAFRSSPSVGIIINGEELVSKEYSTECETSCQIVRFTMPNKDTTVYTHQNGYIAKMCSENNHQYDEGKVDLTSTSNIHPLIYTCKICGHKNIVEQTNVINTKENFTFFPSEKNNLHNEELTVAYETYLTEHNWDLSLLENYEIYNLVSEDIYNKYNLDIFEVYYTKSSYYFIKHNDTIYQISPFDMNNQNSHCVNHVAITDINNDGYIEILTAINSFSDRGNNYYCTSFIKVIDTKTKYSIKITDYSNINYFKENDKGIISIYNANKIMPVKDDLHNGVLDKKYYDLATNLFDTPVLNTSNYEFSEKLVDASCDLFEVNIAINDNSIKFPYLFKSTYTSPCFTINVKMKYLGKAFGYTSPDGYLDGATVSFVNDSSSISCEAFGVTCVITKFFIFNGMEIEKEYRYNEDLNNLNEVGLYDMVITYENVETNLKDSIVIKDFLKLSR